MTDTEAAYIAGIIDGEGYLGLMKQGPGKGRPRATIEVDSIDRDLIQWLHRVAGGFERKPVPAGHRGRNTQERFRWAIRGAAARKLLRRVAPYLVMERRKQKAAALIAS